MTHVLNRSERNYAFWKFLFFFLLSTALIVGAVYFDAINVPGKENTVLKDQVSRYKIQATAQEKFVKSMDDARQMIDSLSKPGANAVYLNQQIAAKIRELDDLQYKDSSMYSRLNKNISLVFLNYQIATNKSISLTDMPRQLEEYKAKYEQSQRDLETTQQSLDVIRKSSSAASGF